MSSGYIDLPVEGGGGGSGTVTSVGLTAPVSLFSVGGSPVATSGVLAISLITQNANKVWAGPTTGADANPTFRALVAADIPVLPYTPTTLTSAHIFVGNGSNVATDVAMTGDIGISNAGVTAIQAGVIVNNDINASAAIDFSKLAALTSGNILVGSAGNVATSVAMSGAITIIANGTTSYNGTVPVNKGGTNITSYTAGDTLYASGSTTLSTLAKGTALQYYRMNAGATAPEWATLVAGDFSGPASSLDNAAVRFDGTSGKTGQGSSLLIGDQSTTATLILSMPDDAVNNSTKAADMALYPAAKTAGTGAGGDLYAFSGSSTGGLYGSVYVGYYNASTTEAVKFSYASGHTQVRFPSPASDTVPAIAFGSTNYGIGQNSTYLTIIAGGANNGFIGATFFQINSDFSILTAGKGLQIKTGSNAKKGTAVLVGGTVAVSNSAVTANSVILLSTVVPGGTQGAPYISAQTASSGFTITSTNAGDTSTVGYVIIDSAP